MVIIAIGIKNAVFRFLGEALQALLAVPVTLKGHVHGF